MGVRESKVVLPTGEEYKLYLQSDGKMEFSKGDLKVSVDNRGRPSFMEKVMEAPLTGVMATAGTVVSNSVKEAVVK